MRVNKGQLLWSGIGFHLQVVLRIGKPAEPRQDGALCLAQSRFTELALRTEKGDILLF
jgi:hypothetical protein